MGKYINW